MFWDRIMESQYALISKISCMIGGIVSRDVSCYFTFDILKCAWMIEIVVHRLPITSQLWCHVFYVIIVSCFSNIDAKIHSTFDKTAAKLMDMEKLNATIFYFSCVTHIHSFDWIQILPSISAIARNWSMCISISTLCDTALLYGFNMELTIHGISHC